MQRNLLFTAGQFAQLHHLNKRTLHYYDDIGLFCPSYKGKNGYRYYTYAQSTTLENILALRELNMSITEIKDYLQQPDPLKFQALSTKKISEIEQNIDRLQTLKNVLQKKQDMIHFSMSVQDGQIDVIHCKEVCLFITPFPSHSQQLCTEQSMELLMRHLQTTWSLKRYKASCGSIIAADKLQQGDFNSYDGLFTQIDDATLHLQTNTQMRPAGSYLRGFCIGAWNKIPALYQRMLEYAKKNALAVTGYAYESGLNEVAVKTSEEYVTQIMIPCHGV